MTTSFEVATGSCVGCKSGHQSLFMKTVGGENGPVCIILGDQNLPGTLPGNVCWPVIRMEEANLIELANKLASLSRGRRLPSGTVVAIGSLSHLARVGLAAYCEDLVDALAAIEKNFGGHVRPVHGLLLPDTAIEDDLMIRQVHDLYAWLLESDKRRRFTLPESYKKFLSMAVEGGANYFGRNRLAEIMIPYKLPVNLTSKERTPFMVSTTSQIKGRMEPLENQDMLDLVRVMVEEVAHEYSLNLRAKTVKSGEQVANKKLTYIIGGGSHASRLANCLIQAKADVRDVTQKGWRLEKHKIQNLACDIRTALESTEPEKTIMILQFLDNDIYHGAVGEDSYVRGSFKGPDNKYHIEGQLAISTDEMLKESFLEAMPVFRACKDVATVLVGPLPRYIMARCCDDQEHLTNFSRPNYANAVAAALKDVGKQLRRLIFYRGMKNVSLYNPNTALRAAATGGEELAAMWGPDPVHPVKEAYQVVARDLMSKATSVHTKWIDTQVAKSTKRQQQDSATGESEDDSVVEVGGRTAAFDRSGSSTWGTSRGWRQKLTPEGSSDRSSGSNRPLYGSGKRSSETKRWGRR